MCVRALAGQPRGDLRTGKDAQLGVSLLNSEPELTAVQCGLFAVERRSASLTKLRTISWRACWKERCANHVGLNQVSCSSSVEPAAPGSSNRRATYKGEPDFKVLGHEVGLRASVKQGLGDALRHANILHRCVLFELQ